MKKLKIHKLNATEKLVLKYLLVMPRRWYITPNLVQFFRCGIQTEHIMEIYADYLPGATLRQKLKRGIQLIFGMMPHIVMYERLSRQGYLEWVLKNMVEKGWLEYEDKMYRLTTEGSLKGRKKIKIKPHDVVVLVHYFRNLIYADNSIDGYNGVFGLPYAESLLENIQGKHLLLASLANVVGKTYMALENFDKAVHYQMIEVEHYEELLTEDDMNLAYSYGMAAIYCYYNEEFADAKDLIEKSADIFQKNVDEEDENYKNLLHWRDDIYEAYEAQKFNY